MGKSVSAQMLEIWLNGRETNGSVADVKREIASQGTEIQKARINLSDHFKNHVGPEETGVLRALNKWFSLGRIVLIAIIAFQPVELSLLGWWLTVHFS